MGTTKNPSVDADKTHTVVSGLQPHSKYVVLVYACIRQLCGGSSNQMQVITFEARKSRVAISNNIHISMSI